MMIRRAFLISILIIFTFTSVALAGPNDVLIDEQFLSWDMINEQLTNAVVDTLLGEVSLPQVTGSQSMAANEDGILVVDDGQIEFYSFDGSNYVYNSYLSHSVLDNPIAAALSPSGFEHFVLHADGTVTAYRFTNGYLHEDPAYRLTGFQSALSVAKSEESLFVLDNRHLKVYKDLGDGIVEVPMLNTKLDIDNPIQITAMGEDLVVLDSHQKVHFYRYTGNAYVKDPGISLLGAGSAIDGATGTIFSIHENRISGFSYTGDSLVKNEYLSFSHSDAYSISGLYDDWTVFVRDSSSVTGYMFTGDSMVPVTNISGLSTPFAGYLSPRELQTKQHTWSEGSRRVHVELTADIPEQTEIELYVSPNGSTFTKVDEKGIAVFSDWINSLVIKAVLKTDNPAVTPVIKRIRVFDKSLDIQSLETTRIVRDPGGNPPLPTEQPVRLTGGYNFDMRVTAPGAIKVKVEFSNGQSLYLDYQDEEMFTGTHYFPLDAIGVFDVHIYAWDEDDREVDRLFPAHYLIDDNIMNQATIYDIR